jgi:hypothetical protein
MKELRVMDLRRVAMDKPVPDTLVRKLFPMGVDDTNIVARMGQKIYRRHHKFYVYQVALPWQYITISHTLFIG